MIAEIVILGFACRHIEREPSIQACVVRLKEAPGREIRLVAKLRTGNREFVVGKDESEIKFNIEEWDKIKEVVVKK